MNKTEIGTNAGIVWHALLDSKDRMTFDELLKAVDLKALDVAAAIGWLAREEKISFSSQEDGTDVYFVYQESYF